MNKPMNDEELEIIRNASKAIERALARTELKKEKIESLLRDFLYSIGRIERENSCQSRIVAGKQKTINRYADNIIKILYQ